jgi:hypothetical protein
MIDADNNDNVINAFFDDKLDVINIDAAEPTDMVGTMVHLFSWMLNKNDIKKTWSDHAIYAHIATTLLVKKR